jgi:hypothetical protein
MAEGVSIEEKGLTLSAVLNGSGLRVSSGAQILRQSRFLAAVRGPIASLPLRATVCAVDCLESHQLVGSLCASGRLCAALRQRYVRGRRLASYTRAGMRKSSTRWCLPAIPPQPACFTLEVAYTPHKVASNHHVLVHMPGDRRHREAAGAGGDRYPGQGRARIVRASVRSQVDGRGTQTRCRHLRRCTDQGRNDALRVRAVIWNGGF